jgi:hypothetical protein
MSRDETAVLVGVNGPAPWYGTRPGRIAIGPDGANTWHDDPAGPHAYLVEAVPPAAVQKLIDPLLLHQPH